VLALEHPVVTRLVIWSISILSIAACGSTRAGQPVMTLSTAGCGSTGAGQPVMTSPLNECQTALVALVEGRLEAWKGAAQCTRADVARVLGPTGPPVPGVFGDAQLYAPHAAAATEIEIAFADRPERIIAVAFWDAHLLPRSTAELGPAELTVPSGLGADVSQHAWPSRGVVVHARSNGATPLVVAFPIMTVDEFEATGIAVLPQAYEDAFPRDHGHSPRTR